MHNKPNLTNKINTFHCIYRSLHKPFTFKHTREHFQFSVHLQVHNSSTNSLELKLTMHSRVSTNSTISTMEAACLLYKFYYKHIRLKHFLQFSFEEGLFYRSNSTSSSSESLSSSSPSTSGESHGNGSVDRRLKKSTRILLQEI